MKHPTFFKICTCIFLKYIVFFLFLMLKNKNYYFISPGIKDVSDLLYYLWLLLALPISTMLLCGIPIYYSFRIKNSVMFFLIVAVIIIGEYFLYTHLASPLDLSNGVYDALFIILFLGIFFFKNFRDKLVKA